MARADRYLPLRERHGLVVASEPALELGVSTHLAHALWDWCSRMGLQASKSDSDLELPQLSLRAHRMCAALAIPAGDRINSLEGFVFEQPDTLLDIVDWILKEDFLTPKTSLETAMEGLNFSPLFGRSRFNSRIEQIDYLLAEAGSAWKVNDPPDSLVLRVPESLGEEYRAAIDIADEASRHLATSWDAAWRRKGPSAKEAYGDAVNAIEAALAPIVIPNEPKPTLGKIIGELEARHNQGRWNTRFRGVETVQALTGLLRELWQTNGRHAGMPPNTLEQAQDAVTIAVAVVALTRHGFLERVEDS